MAHATPAALIYCAQKLRADVLAAAIISVILGRHAGTFDHLSMASAEQLVTAMRDLLGVRSTPRRST
jgi:hypothetical protein